MATMKKKIDFAKIAKNTAIAGATGAVAHVVAEAIDVKEANLEYIDYGLIAGGAILPELVKIPEMETVGVALSAVGGYRLAERNKLADKIGLNQG